MSKQNGISIIEVCLVLISSLLFIYTTAYILHLTRTFNEARDVANDLRLIRESIEINNNKTFLKEGYQVISSKSNYYLVIKTGEKRIDEIFMICTFIKESCGYISDNKMKYISVVRPEVHLSKIGFSHLNSETVAVALLFKV